MKNYDLEAFRAGLKSHNRCNNVSVNQASARAGVSRYEWEKWEKNQDSQPDNIAEILLAVVLNTTPPEPVYNHKREKRLERSKTWKEQNKDKYKEYMREYMRKKRIGVPQIP